MIERAGSRGPTETIFTLEATRLKYGNGAVEELGWEMQRLGLARVLLVADPHLRKLGAVERVLRIAAAAGIKISVFEDVRVEPTLQSFAKAAAFAARENPDGFVAMGGGSTIDTAKVADLITTHGGSIIEYVNAPIGGGKKPASALRPLIAIPTTSGTGSEATSVAVLDMPEIKTKTGISHRFLRPALALVDPELARTTPRAVTASAGLDVVCHAVESFTAKPFTARPRPPSPGDRPPYQGSNPVADLWSMRAIELGGRYLRRAVEDGNDLEARGSMMLGATMAGIGFGSAGVHIPHACAYPLASLKHAWRAPGYETDHAFVPHGFSVIVTSPEAFRFTYDAAPERHIRAAELLTGARIDNPGPQSLPDALIALMQAVGAPRGIAELGYGEEDIPALVEGALKQQRLLVGAPKPIDAGGIEKIMRRSMANW